MEEELDISEYLPEDLCEEEKWVLKNTKKYSRN